MIYAQYEICTRPYKDADFFAWIPLGDEFKCNTRKEAITRAIQSGYDPKWNNTFRIIYRG